VAMHRALSDDCDARTLIFDHPNKSWGSVMHIRRLVLVGAALAMVASISPAGATGTASTYVALGDSYTSGAGLSPYLAGSNGCSRSPEAYPEDVARAMTGAQLEFVACSGATIPQIARQVSAARASLANASLVTLSAGGNDVGFSRLSISCIGALTSPTSNDVRYLPFAGGPSACAGSIDAAAKLLGARVHPKIGALSVPSSVTASTLSKPSPFEGRLLSLVKAVLQSSAAGNGGQGARVLIVSYPVLLAHRTSRACLVGAAPIDLPGGTTLYPAFASTVARELISINSLVRRETASVVRTLDSTQSRLELVNAPSFAPLNCTTGSSSDLNGFSVATLRSGAVLHPTIVGQQVLATAVLGRIN
jgi:lysophospholipase L1-like esterase